MSGRMIATGGPTDVSMPNMCHMIRVKDSNYQGCIQTAARANFG